MLTAGQFFYRSKLTRKATGFKSLRINYCEISEKKSKYQMDFWTKLAKNV